MGRGRRFSRTGLVPCGVYLVLTAASVAGGVTHPSPKDGDLLLVLPLTPAEIFLLRLDPGNLNRLSWATREALLFPPTLAIVYGVGRTMGRTALVDRRPPGRARSPSA